MKRIFRGLSAVILLAIVISFSRLYGQQYLNFVSEIENMKKTATLKIGPFLVYPRFGIGYGYDNNLYGKTAEEGTISGRWISFALPITIYLPFRDWLILDLIVAPRYDYFFDKPNETALNINISPRLKTLLFHRIVATGSLQRSKDKYRVSSEIDQRVWLERSGYWIDLFYDTPRQTSLGFSGYMTRFNYETVTLPDSDVPLSSALNREEKSAKLEFYYRLSEGTFFFSNIGVSDYNFENTGAAFRDSQSYQAYSGIRFPLLGKATGIISLGYKKLVPKQAQYKGYSGIVGDTSVDLRVDRFRFRMGFVRDIPFTYGENNIYYIHSSAQAGISFYLSQRIRLDYDFVYGDDRYPNDQAVPSAVPGQSVAAERRDILRNHSIGFVYRVFQSTGIGLRAEYYERDSDIEGRISRFTWGASLTFQF